MNWNTEDDAQIKAERGLFPTRLFLLVLGDETIESRSLEFSK
jgi:hypothetical protein